MNPIHFERSIAAVALCVGALASNTTVAGGLTLYEVGTADIGLASAGYTARAQDASTVFTNPAGMTRLAGDQLTLGAQVFHADVGFSIEPGTTPALGDNAGGNPIGWFPGGGMFYSKSVSPDVKVGIAPPATSDRRSSTTRAGWAGTVRRRARCSGCPILPTVAWRVNENLSVGASLNAMYGKLKNEVAVNNIVGADGRLTLDNNAWGFGANVGVLYEVDRGTRFGLTYNSPVNLDFRAQPQWSDLGPGIRTLLAARGLLDASVDLGVTVPQGVNASFYREIDPRWAILGSVGWQQWSKFGQVDVGVDSNNPIGLTTSLDFKDTWHVAGGVQYRMSDAWLLNGGIAYDSGFQDGDSVTVALPVNAAWRFGVGGQKEESKTFNWGVSLEYLYGGDLHANVTGSVPVALGGRGDVVGSYNSVNFSSSPPTSTGSSEPDHDTPTHPIAPSPPWPACSQPLALAATGAATAETKGGFETVPSLPGADARPGRGAEGTAAHRGRARGAGGLFRALRDRVEVRHLLRRGREHARRARQRTAGDRSAAGGAESQAFQDSLVRAAQAPVQLVQSAFTNPVGTVENIGQGLGSVLGRVGFLARSTRAIGDGQHQQRLAGALRPAAGSGRGSDAVRVHRRSLRLQQGAPRLGAATQHRPVHVQPGAAAAARQRVGGELCGKLRDQHGHQRGLDGRQPRRRIRYRRPRRRVEPAPGRPRPAERGAAAGHGREPRTTRDFLRNRWFTPSLQTALVVALSKMGGIAGAESVIQVAAQVQGETHVRFFVESVRMLGQYDGKEARLAKLRMSGMVPIGVAEDGTLVVAAAIDYAWWDKAAAEFAQRKELKGKRRVLLVAGNASDRARQEFAQGGLDAAQRAAFVVPPRRRWLRRRKRLDWRGRRRCCRKTPPQRTAGDKGRQQPDSVLDRDPSAP